MSVRATSARAYCFTWNNYNDHSIDSLREFYDAGHCDYIVFGKEIAPTTGTPHLQGYMHLKNSKTMSAVHKLISQDGIALIIAKGTANDNFKYCTEDGEFAEWGDRPSDAVSKCVENNAMYSHFIELSKNGDFTKIEELYPVLAVKHNSVMYRYASLHFPKPPELATVCGEWWFGPKSTGKSTLAMKLNPYVKAKNKWWNGFCPRLNPIVYIDEVDHFHAKWIGPDLKNWADKFPFNAETKGGWLYIRPPRLIVSSNYTFAELWAEDKELAGAIADRFTVRMFTTVYERPRIQPIAI